MADSTKIIELEVLRYHSAQDKEPYYQTFSVPFADDWSVLQGLQYIKDDLDSTLNFRWSCRMAICGSCGYMINGEPKLGCRTFLRNYYPNKVRVGPLDHFPIERDLVVEIDDFIGKLENLKPYIIPNEPRTLEQGEYLQTPAQRDQYEQFSSCINCLLCYAACPQYGLDPGFTGPGALALLHRYNADSRDQGWEARRDVVNAEDGVWRCMLIGYCSEVCPKGVDPAHAINQNKVNSTLDYFGMLKFLLPKGAAK